MFGVRKCRTCLLARCSAEGILARSVILRVRLCQVGGRGRFCGKGCRGRRTGERRLLTPFALTVAVLPAAECGDFLTELNKKPAHLEYVRCEHHPDSGVGDYWVATYRVPGPFAVDTENFLAKTFHMPRLKKTCCVWSNGERAGYYKREFDSFEISMEGEDEAKAFTNTRADWRKLSFFYVTVERHPN